MTGLILSLRDVRKEYVLRASLMQRLRGRAQTVAAVDGVSFDVPAGQIMGIVGESGSGKSTVAQIATGLIRPTSGALLFQGRDLAKLGEAGWREARQSMQMVFQDTHSSLNPRKRIRKVLDEALAARGVSTSARPTEIGDLIRQVGLDDVLLGRFPHELSGGQRQRVGIARALAMKPKLLIADEPVSSLDVSLQGQIINLLQGINRSLKVTIILISHDLAVVARTCSSLVVMSKGRIVEAGAPDKVLGAPKHPYTQALLAAVPKGLKGRRNFVVKAAE